MEGPGGGISSYGFRAGQGVTGWPRRGAPPRESLDGSIVFASVLNGDCGGMAPWGNDGNGAAGGLRMWQ
ncbi:hypothetical protein GCM10010273_11180 [Streptomyces lavendulocolor]